MSDQYDPWVDSPLPEVAEPVNPAQPNPAYQQERGPTIGDIVGDIERRTSTPAVARSGESFGPGATPENEVDRLLETDDPTIIRQRRTFGGVSYRDREQFLKGQRWG